MGSEEYRLSYRIVPRPRARQRQEIEEHSSPGISHYRCIVICSFLGVIYSFGRRDQPCDIHVSAYTKRRLSRRKFTAIGIQSRQVTHGCWRYRQLGCSWAKCGSCRGWGSVTPLAELRAEGFSMNLSLNNCILILAKALRKCLSPPSSDSS